LLFAGVLATTTAVHMLGVFWLSLLCPLTYGTAVYNFLEEHELCYEGVSYDTVMLFGLMFGLVFLCVIFIWAGWETIKHIRQREF
jgi:hypothetical protein